jgi:formate dehydrogenase major subunit
MADAPTPAEVLARLDKLLADRPHRVGHDFSEATRCLTALREQIIGHLRAGNAPPGTAERLARLNAVLSVLVGTHYPVGAPKWPHLARARDSFAALAADLAQP